MIGDAIEFLNKETTLSHTEKFDLSITIFGQFFLQPNNAHKMHTLQKCEKSK